VIVDLKKDGTHLMSVDSLGMRKKSGSPSQHHPDEQCSKTIGVALFVNQRFIMVDIYIYISMYIYFYVNIYIYIYTVYNLFMQPFQNATM